MDSAFIPKDMVSEANTLSSNVKTRTGLNRVNSQLRNGAKRKLVSPLNKDLADLNLPPISSNKPTSPLMGNTPSFINPPVVKAQGESVHSSSSNCNFEVSTQDNSHGNEAQSAMIQNSLIQMLTQKCNEMA